MPLNDYHCEDCDEVFEVLDLNRKDIKDELICEKCGVGKAKKIISNTSFRLNGEGWFKDGYSYEYSQCKAGAAEKKGKAHINTLDSKLNSIKVRK